MYSTHPFEFTYQQYANSSVHTHCFNLLRTFSCNRDKGKVIVVYMVVYNSTKSIEKLGINALSQGNRVLSSTKG